MCFNIIDSGEGFLLGFGRDRIFLFFLVLLGGENKLLYMEVGELGRSLFGEEDNKGFLIFFWFVVNFSGFFRLGYENLYFKIGRKKFRGEVGLLLLRGGVFILSSSILLLVCSW